MNYGSVLPKDFIVPSSAFWLKNDLGKRNPFELLDVRFGDTVMDCGSCIGSFAVAARQNGANLVVCYEPAPKNLEVLKQNLAPYIGRIALYEAALTATNEACALMSLSGFTGANSIVKQGKNMITVPALNFRRQLFLVKPDVLKLDVEGAEYDLLDSLQHGDLAFVRDIFIEFHPIADRELRVARVLNFLTGQGFIVKSKRLRATVLRRDAI